MRIHHLFIALIIMSLFAVVLSSVAEDMFSGPDRDTTGGIGLARANYSDDESSQNASDILSKLSILTATESTVGDIASNAPGGTESNIPTEEGQTADGWLERSGLSVVTKVGVFLFSVPRTVFGSIASYFNINPAFTTAAITVFVLIVAIILVSSILRNRL